MSAQDHALEGGKLKDKNPAPNGILEVTVQARAGESGVHPRTITLTNQVHTVRWTCHGLPRGAMLQIHFLEDLRGPFMNIVQSHAEVSGYGNRGPRATVREYAYQARIIERDGTSRLAGEVLLINSATKAVGHPGAGGGAWPPEVPPNT